MPTRYNLMDGTYLTMPDKPADSASVKEKTAYWLEMDKLYNEATTRDRAHVNSLQQKLNGIDKNNNYDAWLEAANQLVAAEATYERGKSKSDNVSVSTSEDVTKDGENVRTSKRHTIRDEKGNDVSIGDTSDNAGKTQSEINAEIQRQAQRDQDYQDVLSQANTNISNTEGTATAAKSASMDSATKARDAELAQIERNKGLISSDYQSDLLEGNQDLLRASNTIRANAQKNTQEAQGILGRYSLTGSSLAPRLGNIAANAANEAAGTASLTYNQKMNEAIRNQNDSLLELEDQTATTQNAYSQREAQASRDYYSNLAGSYGKAAEATSPYNQAQSSAFAQQAAGAATDMGSVRASQYVSNYAPEAQRQFNAGLSVYRPVNSSRTLIANETPKLTEERKV